MAKKKEVYHVKPLTEGKKNIIASLINEYDIVVLRQEKVPVKLKYFI